MTSFFGGGCGRGCQGGGFFGGVRTNGGGIAERRSDRRSQHGRSVSFDLNGETIDQGELDM